jgi:hypothetical protein
MSPSSPLPDLALAPAALVALKARHLAFLEARLVSDAAEAEWKTCLGPIVADLLATRVGDLASPTRLADAADALFTAEAVERSVRPLARHVVNVVLAELRTEQGTVGARVPAATKARIDALLERPGLFPDRLVRALSEEDAVEEVLRDTLHDALKEFSEKVNPFVADWGLPALLKRLGPFGMGGIGKSFDTMRVDFEKRLDPEIRKFLQGMTRKSLRKMVELVIAKADEPRFVAVRKSLARWLLEQEIATLARSTDAEVVLLGQEIALDLLAAELSREGFRARRRALIEAALVAHQDRPLREVLDALGVGVSFDDGALATATWPLVRSALATPAVRAWLATIVGEFYDAEIAAAGAANA